ncbi:hypothetical protein H4R33_002360 [Dimargaris cristalligena]|uniref:Enoyl reductase (ER) domain-containing protein n=1 Tax=Dimargaris cristalligena TaxID=215637 RepID=A0A4P9ZVF1_9FUNG|nr:hypothetical protein H4R33_002360 [Dimargaris cristalligena]RKP37258.1 hypothetical protein BJ085DRAFT_24181 [Dimargaris cristalligena]|eukprot:RKP37258.1 hypothetical protein BJ085DRAFT_24181 [Dimargaris cristalligena]
MSNTTVLLKESSPYGKLATSNFEVKKTDKLPTEADLSPNEIVVRNRYISIDPYLRNRMTGTDGSYIGSYKPGEPITSIGVGEVAASLNADYPVGTKVLTPSSPWSTYAVYDPVKMAQSPLTQLNKLEGPLADVPLDWHVGVLGMPSFTAWYGLLEIGKPKAGETLVVSAASGAVGQAVVQLGKSLGLRVVAAAGTDEKVAYLKDTLKIDAAFNYKTVDDYTKTLKELCPKGIDIYFDNVGGEFLDAVLANINRCARIAACGAISQYEKSKSEQYGIKNLMSVVGNEVTFQGFIISPYYPTHYAKFAQDIVQRVKSGSFNYKLDITKGIENAPQAMMKVMEGRNFGKTIVEV